jgi:hypothetical protein
VHPCWLLLGLELALWRRHGRKPLLWWRDDDAVRDTLPLRQLLALATAHGAPLTLAVIPSDDIDELVAPLACMRGIEVAQHGVTHRNLQPPGELPSEFPVVMTVDALCDALDRTAQTMRALPNRLPVFVPAWNRLTPALAAVLPRSGFAAISGHARHGVGLGTLPRLDVHLDLLRWGGQPRFRGEGRFLLRLVRLLRERRLAARWEEPIGLLTHHLDHDGAAWDFLGRFLALARRRFVWTSAGALLAAGLAAADDRDAIRRAA